MVTGGGQGALSELDQRLPYVDGLMVGTCPWCWPGGSNSSTHLSLGIIQYLVVEH